MKLSTRRRIYYVLVLTVIWVAQPLLMLGQTGSSQRGQSNTIGSGTMDGIYYVDEVGIRLATDGLPMEGFIDADTYTLGSLDILSIEVRGTIPVTFRGLIVNSQGNIIIPTVGNIRVGDMTLTQASQLIKNEVGLKYNSKDIHITLEKPKPVHVHVTGDVGKPGRYIFPAQTRVDAVVIPILLGLEPEGVTADLNQQQPSLRRTLGGQLVVNRNPVESDEQVIETDAYSELNQYAIRKISIRHRNGDVTMADLTAYFNGGLLEYNPFVQDGEVITVHKRTNHEVRTGISGGVRFAFEGEYRADDTIIKLLKIAGGFSETADTTHFFIYRYDNGNYTPERIDGSPQRMGDAVQLLPNDRVIIPVKPRLRQSVTAVIDGEVLQPGKFPLPLERATVSELLRLSGGLTGDALPHGAYIERNPDTGLNRVMNQIEASLIKRSSDQLNEGFQYLDFDRDLSTRFIFVDLRNIDQTTNFKLYDGDRLIVPRDEGTVLVFGQVNRTGYYLAAPEVTVDHYLEQAGGLTLAADASRIFIIKAGSQAWYRPGETTLESGDKVFVDRIPYDDLQASRTYDLQRRQLRNNNISIILAGVSAVAAVITASVALSR